MDAWIANCFERWSQCLLLEQKAGLFVVCAVKTTSPSGAKIEEVYCPLLKILVP